MIPANELRIGNYVYLDGYEEITAICKDGVKTNFVDTHFVFFESIYGIPLTPEILEKCGAEAKGVMGTTEIHWKIGNYLISQSEIDRMGSLHFLQNWYYFKTFGEELIVNL